MLISRTDRNLSFQKKHPHGNRFEKNFHGPGSQRHSLIENQVPKTNPDLMKAIDVAALDIQTFLGDLQNSSITNIKKFFKQNGTKIKI